MAREEYLLLKWGTIKGCDLTGNDAAMGLARKWSALGVNWSAAMQGDTPEQKAIICEIIRAVNGPITNDWSGEEMTKDEAVEYVMRYAEE